MVHDVTGYSQEVDCRGYQRPGHIDGVKAFGFDSKAKDLEIFVRGAYMLRFALVWTLQSKVYES